MLRVTPFCTFRSSPRHPTCPPTESRLATCLAGLAPSPRIRSHLVAVKGFTGRVGREAACFTPGRPCTATQRDRARTEGRVECPTEANRREVPLRCAPGTHVGTDLCSAWEAVGWTRFPAGSPWVPRFWTAPGCARELRRQGTC